RECRAVARPARHFDAAAVGLHDVRHDGQTEPRAFDVVNETAADAIELLEDLLLLARLDPDAVVGDRDAQRAIFHIRAHLDLLPLAGILHGVVEQIDSACAIESRSSRTCGSGAAISVRIVKPRSRSGTSNAERMSRMMQPGSHSAN